MLMMMVEDMVRVVLMIILRKVLLYRMESSDRLSGYGNIIRRSKLSADVSFQAANFGAGAHK